MSELDKFLKLGGARGLVLEVWGFFFILVVMKAPILGTKKKKKVKLAPIVVHSILCILIICTAYRC